MNEQTRDPDRVKADEVNEKLVQAFERISVARRVKRWAKIAAGSTLLLMLVYAGGAPKRW